MLGHERSPEGSHLPSLVSGSALESFRDLRVKSRKIKWAWAGGGAGGKGHTDRPCTKATPCGNREKDYNKDGRLAHILRQCLLGDVVPSLAQQRKDVRY